MSLQSTAQELIVVEPDMASSMDGEISLIPLEIIDEPHGMDHDHDMEHNHENKHDEGNREMSHIDFTSPMEVSEHDDGPLVVSELPGAPEGTKDPEPEPVLEVSEDDDMPTQEDNNEAAKSKKNEKWDWESKGSHGFISWVKERINDVPKHSGYDSAGLERAMSYLEKLDNEISRAMRLDLDGELDANKVEEVRAQIDEGISRLHDRLDKVKKHSKTRRKKKKSDAEMSGLIKEAQKVTGVQGIYIVAPLFASRIARVCINGMVSAGHDIEDLYARQVKRWKLSDREQAEVMQLLADMGYPLRQDRGFMPDEDVDFASSDNMDWAANYKG